MTARRTIAGCALAIACALTSRSSAEPSDDPPLPTAPPDRGPPGPYISRGVRPADSGVRACHGALPVCVWGHDAGRTEATLDAATEAWRALVHVLGFPAPDVSLETGAWDVYLVSGLLGPGEDSATRLEWRDTRSAYDRAQGFSLVDARLRRGCRLEAALVRALADAIRLRVAPAIDEGSALSQTTYLAELVKPCRAALATDAARAYQARATSCITDPRVDEPAHAAADRRPMSRAARLFSEGGALFYGRTEWAFARRPGSLVWSTWALLPTKTALGQSEWHDEPDTFDILRTSFEGALFTRSTIHDLMLDFGVARAFMGSADDGEHHPESRVLADAARVTPDWDVPWPSTPKRYRQRVAVAPTGSSYVVVSTKGAPPAARLRVEVEWEEHALFRWAVVKLDAAGREIGRLAIPTRERATSAQMSVVDLAGADRVLLVGVNVGDPAYRFDPDDGAWEPHGWLLTIAAE